MTFEVVNKAWSDASINISCIARQKGLCLVVRIRSRVLEDINVKIGSRLIVERGNHKDAKWLRLSPGNITGFKISKSGHRGVTGCLYLVALADTIKHPGAPAPHKILNGSLYVELPKWARAKTV